MTTRYTQAFWISIFSLFLLASVFMIKRAISPHNRKVHIIIKPSSVDSYSEIAESLKKSLYPLYFEKTPLKVISTDLYTDLKLQMENIFNLQDQAETQITISSIDLESKQASPCLKEIKKRMTKNKKKWTKNIFFSACTTDAKNLEMAIATRD